MERLHPKEDTARVVILGVAAWAAFVAGAAFEGAFATATPGECAAFALGVAGFAVATYLFDRELRGFLAGLATAPVATAAGLLDVALVVALCAGWWPVVAALAPMTALASAAALERIRVRQKPRSAPAKSPGAHPAAT